jgi:hypothetical protein
MDEDGTARFGEGPNLGGGDYTVLEFRSGSLGGDDDVVGLRHELIIIAGR